jgi:thymidylate kinase
MNSTNKGKYYVLEGPSGVGKTSIAQVVLEKLIQDGVKAKYFKFNENNIDYPLLESRIKEPLLFELLRKWNFDDEIVQREINPLCVALLGMAAKIDLFQRYVKPMLVDEGYVVLSDRYWWSAYVLGRINNLNEDVLSGMEQIYNAVTLKPNIMFHLLRKTSLKNVKPKIWNIFAQEYTNLSERQKSNLNIINIYNENEFSTAVDTLYSHIKNDINK